jgi:hypothetical protein
LEEDFGIMLEVKGQLEMSGEERLLHGKASLLGLTPFAG